MTTEEPSIEELTQFIRRDASVRLPWIDKKCNQIADRLEQQADRIAELEQRLSEILHENSDSMSDFVYAKLRDLEGKLKPTPKATTHATDSTLTQDIQALRDAGGDAWDGVQDVEAELGRREPEGKTARVRMPVCVEADGAWYGQGSSLASQCHQHCVTSGRNAVARYWLTADLPIPQIPEIPASVERAGGDE